MASIDQATRKRLGTLWIVIWYGIRLTDVVCCLLSVVGFPYFPLTRVSITVDGTVNIVTSFLLARKLSGRAWGQHL